MWPFPFEKAIPFIAKLQLSVPHPVKIISLGEQFRILAMLCRAQSTTLLAFNPNE